MGGALSTGPPPGVLVRAEVDRVEIRLPRPHRAMGATWLGLGLTLPAVAGPLFVATQVAPAARPGWFTAAALLGAGPALWTAFTANIALRDHGPASFTLDGRGLTARGERISWDTVFAIDFHPDGEYGHLEVLHDAGTLQLGRGRPTAVLVWLYDVLDALSRSAGRAGAGRDEAEAFAAVVSSLSG